MLIPSDGGGIRGYSSLLMIAALMKYIGEAERSGEYGDPHRSSFFPSKQPLENNASTTRKSFSKQKTTSKTRPKEISASKLEKGTNDLDGLLTSYLPCHYFGLYNPMI
jgi:hypothetical protein